MLKKVKNRKIDINYTKKRVYVIKIKESKSTCIQFLFTIKMYINLKSSLSMLNNHHTRGFPALIPDRFKTFSCVFNSFFSGKPLKVFLTKKILILPFGTGVKL